jgi:hypothetical protein
VEIFRLPARESSRCFGEWPSIESAAREAKKPTHLLQRKMERVRQDVADLPSDIFVFSDSLAIGSNRTGIFSRSRSTKQAGVSDSVYN